MGGINIIPKVGLTVIKNGKVLLVKEKDWDFLGFAGGSKEFGEDEAECLEREIKEEFGVHLKTGSAKYFGTFEDKAEAKNDIGKRVEIKLFLVEFDGEPKKTEEVEKIVWLGRDDNLKELGEIDKSIMESLIKNGLVK